MGLVLMGVMMSRSQALAVAKAIRDSDPEGEQSLVRISRYAGALHVELIKPPFGGAREGRVVELLRAEDPEFRPDLDSLQTAEEQAMLEPR